MSKNCSPERPVADLVGGGWRDESGALWLTSLAALDAYEICRTDLTRWRKQGCPWLGRRRIRARRIWIGETAPGRYFRRRRLWVYAVEDLETVRDLRTCGRSAPGDPWPSSQEAVALGISLCTLQRLRGFKDVRRRRGLRVRPNGRVVRVTEWHPQVLERVRQERETRATSDEEWLTDREVRGRFGLAQSTMTHWRSPRGCPYLGRPLRAKRRAGVWVTSRADLEEILRRRTTGREDEHVDPDGTVWLPSSLVAKRHGIVEQILSGLRQRDEHVRRVRKGAVGRPRKAPPIRSKVINRPVPGARGGRMRVWLQADVLAYLAYRSGEGGGTPGAANATDQEARAGKMPDAREVETAATSEPATDQEGAGTSRRGGRPRSPETESVQRFCYEQYVAGVKLATIRTQAARRFGHKAPKQDCHVTEYARRYAQRHGLPLQRPQMHEETEKTGHHKTSQNLL